jgi:hypothetical protein
MLLQVLTHISCIHNTDLPLENSIPVVSNLPKDSVFRKNLAYPDSFVSNLEVSDLNDKVLTVKTDTGSNGDWRFATLNSAIGMNRFAVYSSGSDMDTFTGNWVIEDPENASVRARYLVTRSFYSPIDTTKADSAYWPWYTIPNSISNKLLPIFGKTGEFVGKRFNFGPNDIGLSGIRSSFRLTGDFVFVVSYSLYYPFAGRYTGFQTGFSLNADTAGPHAGNYMEYTVRSDDSSGLVAQCATNLDSASDSTIFPLSATIRFSRTGSAISIDWQTPPTGFTHFGSGVFQSPADTCYLHIWMLSTNSINLTKYCWIRNFNVYKGNMVF